MRRLLTWSSALALLLGSVACDSPPADVGGDDDDDTPAVDAAPGEPDAGGGDTTPDAAPAAAKDTEEPGEYDVKQEDKTATGNVKVTVFAPSTDGGATIASGSFPLVIVSPGFQLQRGQYAGSAEHIASWGYVVVTRDFAANATDHMALATETVKLIDWATGAGSGLAAHIDAAEIATVGHSMGGKVSMLTAAIDDRVKLVVGWDPVDAKPPFSQGGISVTPEMMGNIGAKIVVLGETLDGTGDFQACAPTADNFQQYFMDAPGAAIEITVKNADHMDWVESTQGCLACGFCKKGTAEPAEVQAVTRRTTVAFLRRWFDGDAAMDTWLTGAGIQADQRVSVRTK